MPTKKTFYKIRFTRRIYRNAGTGAFTYGNDLKYPIPAS